MCHRCVEEDKVPLKPVSFCQRLLNILFESKDVMHPSVAGLYKP